MLPAQVPPLGLLPTLSAPPTLALDFEVGDCLAILTDGYFEATDGWNSTRVNDRLWS